MSLNPPEPGPRHADLLRVAEALRNEKALFALLVTGLLAGGLIWLGNSLGGSSSFMAVTLYAVVFLLIFPVGGACAGLLLMDQARGRETRALGKAVLDGIPTALRHIGVVLAGLAVTAVFFLFLYLLLFVCRVPFLGPALYAVLFPILAIAAGLLFFGFTAACAMAGPATWNGATAGETLSILARLAARRGPDLLTLLLALALLLFLIETALSGIVALGYLAVAGASSSVLSIPILPGIVSGVALGAGNEYAMAFAFGSMLALVLVSVAVTALAMMGLSLIYLRLAADPAPAQAREGVPDAPSHVFPEKKEPTIQPAETRIAAPPPPAAAAPGTADDAPDILAARPAEARPEAAACPHCQAAILPGDRFCGECGGKIQG
ncbi:MAG: zinc ribbon domain-containing protein [Azoarcus sp.]|jgi:hypothetical protein|nr:zinc ribbon domain-containing protein [Azoarcus sp.]